MVTRALHHSWGALSGGLHHINQTGWVHKFHAMSVHHLATLTVVWWCGCVSWVVSQRDREEEEDVDVDEDAESELLVCSSPGVGAARPGGQTGGEPVSGGGGGWGMSYYHTLS